jgi:micrococcal nuclease
MAQNNTSLSHNIIITVLGMVAAAGGYGGYTVYKDSPAGSPIPQHQVHTVQSVIDGDTLILADDARVRLLGIDAPESSECYGLQASNALRDLVVGQEVRLEKDMTAVDEFGRHLRYVYLINPDTETNNILVNHWLVKEGYALDESSTPDKRHRIYLAKAAEAAQRESKGLWAECEVEQTSQAQNDSQPANSDCRIKGNISNEGAGRTYFLPGCGNYGRVKIDPTMGEQYFCSRDAAEAAGFTLSNSCTNNGIE